MIFLGPSRRKLWACALSSFLPLQDAQILDRYGQILEAMVMVLEECSKESEIQFLDRSSIISRSMCAKKKDLLQTDQIPETQLRLFLRTKIQESITVLGQDHFNTLLEMTETNVSQKILTL